MRVMMMMFVVMMIEWGVVMSSSDLNKDLIAACAEGKDNVDEIRGLIEKGARRQHVDVGRRERFAFGVYLGRGGESSNASGCRCRSKLSSFKSTVIFGYDAVELVRVCRIS